MISGLGADHRMFQNLDLKEFDISFIEWRSPSENESITNYAKRLVSQIKHENPVLIGLSFGGLIAIEISKSIQVEKIILISSMKSKYDIPLYFRIFGKTNLQKVVPFSLLRKINSANNWLFGAKSDIEKLLLKETLENTESSFLKWAVNSIITWTSEKVPNNVYQIHGTKDRLLPVSKIKNSSRIENGTHFMILEKAEEISGIIRDILK